jgi:hypothetical protein
MQLSVCVANLVQRQKGIGFNIGDNEQALVNATCYLLGLFEGRIDYLSWEVERLSKEKEAMKPLPEVAPISSGHNTDTGL